MITAKMGKKEKGNLFETFTYYLIKHEPRLNNGLEKIWMFNDIPKNILTELNLPSTDKGIDLLAVINGKYYAIQCKFRQDPNKIISWGELSTFFGLSFGMNNKIAGGFFVTNTRNLCQEVINSKKVIPIYDDFYDSLTSNFFKNITSNKIIYERKYKNKPQIDSVMYACAHFFDHRRGYMEMACGTGKTLASYWIANAISLGKTVIFVPSLQLLSQFYSDWVNQSHAEEKNLKYLLIGSDADVEDEIKEKSNGLMLCLDPIEIRKHLDGNVVVICTYQSADKLAEACNKKIKFDLGIFDEAHKTVGQRGKLFSRMLTNDELIINKRLFMTATPKIYIGDDDDIMSMDNKDVYGECFYTYNTGKAIDAGLLTDYQVLSIYATNDAIMRDIKANKLVRFKKMFSDKEAKYLAIILVLLKKIADGTINHLLTYHNTIARAIKFAEFLIQINELLYGSEIYVASIDGKDSMRTRKNIIEEYKRSKVGIICSAKVLNEGVNIPVVDSVCFVDARESTIDIAQCIGRCLRLYDGKKIAHVIVPIFIEDLDDEFDKNTFGTVIRILKTMKSTDDGIAEYFKLNDHGIITNRKIICSEYYDVSDVNKEVDICEWEQALNCILWKIVDSWEHTCVRLEQYVLENGKIPSSKSKNLDEKLLGVWCVIQRTNNRQRILPDDRIQRLNYLDGWRWDYYESWNDKYIRVKEYIKKNNKIPSRGSDEPNMSSLYEWCRGQRRKKHEGKLSDDLVAKLNTLDLWYWTDETTDKTKISFDTRHYELQQWIDINKRMPNMSSECQFEKKLATWCSVQRRNKKKGILSDARIERMDTLPGWFWEGIKSWDERYIETKEFIDKNNRLPTKCSKKNAEKSLAMWCKLQRYRQKNLSPNEIDNLSNLKGWVWAQDRMFLWNEQYKKVSKFLLDNDRLPSKSTDQYENKLAKWCTTQRSLKKNNKLSPDDKIKSLNNLRGWYWTHSGSKTANPTKGK